MSSRSLWIFSLLLLFTWCIGCKQKSATLATDTYDSGVIHISCDESFKPVIDAQVQVYESSFPKVKIIVHYKPEADCLRDMAVDSIRMVIATRPYTRNEEILMSDSLKVNPSWNIVAYDAIAVIVNPAAKDSMFSMEEIRNLLTGNIKKRLIPVMDGVKATSTVRFLLDSVLQNGESLGSNVLAADSSKGVIDYVARTPEAVGFIGVSWVANTEDTSQLGFLKKIKVARLESTDSTNGYVPPVQLFIYTRGYPMIRSLVYVLKEKHYGVAHGFADFLSKDRGQLIFRRSYIFPALRPFYNRNAELQED